MIKSKPCKECGSIYHTAMYHKPKKPIKRTAIKSKVQKMHVGKEIMSASNKKKTAKTKTSAQLKKPLIKNLDKLVKDFVKERDNYTCQRCGKFLQGSDCHASHVIPVSRSGYLQFDPLNMKVLCMHDHLHWWHKHPIEAGKWYTDTFPERWEYLEALHKQRLKPMNVVELQEKIDYYKGLLK